MRQTLARLAERLGTVPYPKNMVSGRHSEELVGGRHSEGLVSGRHCDYLVSGRHCEELVAIRHCEDLVGGRHSEGLVAIRHCEERTDMAICCKSKSYSVVFCNPLKISVLVIEGWAFLEAAEKVPLYMLISCNYILIVAGYFVSLSY